MINYSGVSGSDKTDEIENLNRKSFRHCLFSSKPNQTNLNQSRLVQFSIFNFKIQRTDEPNRR